MEIGGALRVRHRFHPSSRPELYQLDVTIENIGDSLADVVYRRAMDWDVPPTEFSEYVTIQGAHSRLLDSTDYGFQNVNPLLPLYDLGARGTFEDVGPGDVGSVFDFGLGTLAPGASASLTLFYGAASSEADALAALEAVGADLYSLGQPSTPDGPTLGTPNTFMFGAADGGVPTGPVIATGRLVLPKGGEEPPPISGSVALYLPNLDGAARSEDTLIATTTTALDGTFTLRADSSPALEVVAAANDGQINLDLVANVNGWVYHESVIRAAAGGVGGRERADTTGHRHPPDRIDRRQASRTRCRRGCDQRIAGLWLLRDLPVSARLCARLDDDRGAAHSGGYRARDVHVRPEGRLVHRQGVLARRELLGDEGTVRVANETGSSSSATIGYSTTRDRWAHEIQTEFVYTKYRTELWCASPAAVKVSEAYEIRATKWVGSSRLGRDLRHLDDQCAEDHAEYLTPFGRGFRFTRDQNRYGTFTNAASVTVGGTAVSLNGRSGLSRWVIVDWQFGSKSTRHVLCGIDAFPPTASRIYAGA